MTADDLSAPLGLDRGPKGWRAFRISLSQTAIAAFGLSTLMFAAWAMFGDDPFGGEPAAIAPAALVAGRPGNKPERAGAELPKPAANDPRNLQGSPLVDSLTSAAPVNSTVTIIDGASGRQQEIVIPGTADFDSMDQQPAESTRRGRVGKAAPSSRSPARSAPAPEVR